MGALIFGLHFSLPQNPRPLSDSPTPLYLPHSLAPKIPETLTLTHRRAREKVCDDGGWWLCRCL